MNLIDYWFLNTAIVIPTSFNWIIPYEEYEVSDVYHTPFNLTTNQIVEVMYRLFKDGILLAITSTDLKSLDSELIDNLLTKCFIPSRKEIKTTLEREEELLGDVNLELEYREEELLYFVTQKGGQLWEFWSKPKWNQFFRRCILNWESVSENLWNNSIPPYGSIFCCANQEFGEKIISIEPLLDYPDFIPYPIKGSVTWGKFTPWHPTYWKTLPCGYVVSYQVELVKIDKNTEQSNESPELIEQKKQAREWYKNITNWYKNYYNDNEN